MSKSKLPANWQNEWIPLWDAVLQIGKHIFKNQWDEDCLLIDTKGLSVEERVKGLDHHLIVIPFQERYAAWLHLHRDAETYHPDVDDAIALLSPEEAKALVYKQIPAMFEAPETEIEAKIDRDLKFEFIVVGEGLSKMFSMLKTKVFSYLHDGKLRAAGTLTQTGSVELINSSSWLNNKVTFWKAELLSGMHTWNNIKVDPTGLAVLLGQRDGRGRPPDTKKLEVIRLIIQFVNEDPALEDKHLLEKIHRHFNTWEDLKAHKGSDKPPYPLTLPPKVGPV